MDLILGIVLRKWLRLLKTALFLGQNILGDYVKLSILYGSEAWTIYAKQERKLNSLHMRSLHLILGIIWSERVA